MREEEEEGRATERILLLSVSRLLRTLWRWDPSKPLRTVSSVAPVWRRSCRCAIYKTSVIKPASPFPDLRERPLFLLYLVPDCPVLSRYPLEGRPEAFVLL